MPEGRPRCKFLFQNKGGGRQLFFNDHGGLETLFSMPAVHGVLPLAGRGAVD
jgi:hypothetical protein